MKRRRHRAFTLIEILTVVFVSSLLLVVIASLFKAGLWEVGRSSGRIEIVRQGRQALDRIQQYLSSAVAPTGLADGDGPIVTPVYEPWTDEIYDPATGTPPPSQRVRFYTAIDHLTGTPPPTARQIQASPPNLAYEIAPVPGVNNQGQDIVLRRMQQPVSVTNPRPIIADTSVQPRVLARRLGIPDPAAPGGYRDGLVVRRLRDGAIQIEVNASSAQVTDDYNRNQLESHTPLVVNMRTIYQPPWSNLN